MSKPPHKDGPSNAATAFFISTLRRRLGAFGEIAVVSSIVNLLALVASFFSMQVYDRVIPNKAESTLIILFTGVVLAALLEALLRTFRSYLLEKTNQRMELELSQHFFNKALSIRMDARPQTIGSFASQIRDFDSVKSFMSTGTLYAISDLPFALVFLGILALLAGEVALAPLVALPLAAAIGYLSQKPVQKLTELSARDSTFKSGMLVESIDGAESIKATGGEGWFSQRWHQLTLSVSEINRRMRNYNNLAQTLTNLVTQICYASVIVLGANAIQEGRISMGALIACSILVNRILSPFSQMSSMAVSFHQAREALKALNDMMARPSVGDDRKGDTVDPERFEPSYRLENVVLSYGSDKIVGAKVDAIQIPEGSRIAIVGPSGSGKSSLLKLLTGLFKPNDGRVFCSGIDIQYFTPDVLRRRIGYLPQDVRLFNGTLKDNLCLGINAPSDDALISICDLTGLSALIKAHPKGLGLPIFEGGRGLSGGQRQMVALARVLLQEPDILLLDEPTASLDSKSEARLLERLQVWIKPHQTVIVVTHKPALLQMAERVIVLDQGQISFDGPKSNLVVRQG